MRWIVWFYLQAIFLQRRSSVLRLRDEIWTKRGESPTVVGSAIVDFTFYRFSNCVFLMWERCLVPRDSLTSDVVPTGKFFVIFIFLCFRHGCWPGGRVWLNARMMNVWFNYSSNTYSGNHTSEMPVGRFFWSRDYFLIFFPFFQIIVIKIKIKSSFFIN